MNFFLVGTLLVIMIGWIIRENVKHIYELICDLSDDINDIKRKLGLPIENRTPHQRKQSTIQFIKKEIYEGKTLKELKEMLGFWDYYKYKGYIDLFLKDYVKFQKDEKEFNSINTAP